jgi:hypothetical protein
MTGLLDLTPDIADAGIRVGDGVKEFRGESHKLILANAIEESKVYLRGVEVRLVGRIGVNYVDVGMGDVHDALEGFGDGTAEVDFFVDVVLAVDFVVWGRGRGQYWTWG